MKKIYIILLLILLTLEISALGGGSISTASARSAAMGSSYTASSFGINSIGINPANLVFMDKNDVQFSFILPLPNFNASIGNEVMTFDDFNYYFGGVENPEGGDKIGRYLTDTDKDNLRKLFEDGKEFYSDVSLNLLSISVNAGKEIGVFGFSIVDKMALNAEISKDMVDLVIDGNEENRVYDFSDTKFRAAAFREYSFSYGREITDLVQEIFGGTSIFNQINAGISFKYLQGFAYAELDYINTQFSTDFNNGNAVNVSGDLLFNIAASPDFGIEYDFEDDVEKESNVGAFPEAAGSGFGIDIGFSGRLAKYFYAGLAITDIGGMTWDNGTVQYISNVDNFSVQDLTLQDKVDSLADALTGEGGYSDGFDTGLPTALRIGGMMDVAGYFKMDIPLLVALDYNQGLNDEPGNDTTPRVSIGAEIKPLIWLPIRTGFSFGGRDGFNFSFGFGFDAGIMAADFAVNDFDALFKGNSSKRIGISIGSYWKI